MYEGFRSSSVSTVMCWSPISRAVFMAISSSCEARDSETPVTASVRLPSAFFAKRATSELSTPAERATTTPLRRLI